ncbi:MAG: hypothetical protein IJH76_02895 [Clostridia bacterium]|nr:hypothetical protein [Clostridia bacterium]
MKNINEMIEKILNQIKGKDIIVLQEGFIESKLNIEKAQGKLEEDIFSIKGESVYIRININQIYNVDYNQNKIVLYLDNDTKISVVIN